MPFGKNQFKKINSKNTGFKKKGFKDLDVDLA
jgi:hypothetical protein